MKTYGGVDEHFLFYSPYFNISVLRTFFSRFTVLHIVRVVRVTKNVGVENCNSGNEGGWRAKKNPQRVMSFSS
jgi:hypothetical protein